MAAAAGATTATHGEPRGGGCSDCQECQRGKVTLQATAAVDPIPVPRQRFHHVHIDIVGLLPEGFTYVLTIIDRATRWLEATPMKTMDTAACVDAMIQCWVPRYGVPAILTSDRGTQFVSAVWQSLCRRLGIQQAVTTEYHPQANGMVERAHCQLKDVLRARLAGPQWLEYLPWALLGLRAAPKEDSAVSSAELMFGAPLVLPGQLLQAAELPIAEVVKKLRDLSPPAMRKLSYAQTAASVPPGLMTARYVYVRRGGVSPPLSPPYQGPYLVLSSGPKFFHLQVSSREETVSVDRLKPHLGEATVLPAAPVQRGRPRLDPTATSPSTASATTSPAVASSGRGPCNGRK
jgi:Integrase core domain